MRGATGEGSGSRPGKPAGWDPDHARHHVAVAEREVVGMNDMNFSGFGELLPEITEMNAPFWKGLAQGEVRLQKCGKCGAHQYPPESFCYECGAQEVAWVAVAGQGTVYS